MKFKQISISLQVSFFTKFVLHISAFFFFVYLGYLMVPIVYCYAATALWNAVLSLLCDPDLTLTEFRQLLKIVCLFDGLCLMLLRVPSWPISVIWHV